MRIVYMGTPNFAVPSLEALNSAGFEVMLAISQQDKPKGRGKKIQASPVKEKSIELGIKVHQPKSVNDLETINMLKELEPDFIVVAAYGQILKEEILSIPKYCCLNIHASLLPKYRGAAPINWAIINGETETGITIMKMGKGLDTGPMLMQKKIQIASCDTAVSLQDKLAELGSKSIISTIEEIVSGVPTYEEQDHARSSYAPMLNKDSGRIDWQKSAEQIKNLARGLDPWPSAYSIYKGLTVKIRWTEIELAHHCYPPGLIVDVDPKGITVAVPDGYIIIKELQFPNKKSMSISAYLLGNSIEEGYIF